MNQESRKIGKGSNLRAEEAMKSSHQSGKEEGRKGIESGSQEVRTRIKFRVPVFLLSLFVCSLRL